MAWLGSDRTFVGALARRDLFGRPEAGDEALIRGRIDHILARQRSDGTLGEVSIQTAAALHELLALGCGRADARINRALRALARQAQRADPSEEAIPTDGHYPLVVVKVLCEAGCGRNPRVRPALRHYAGHSERWLADGLPWTPGLALATLWAGRDIEDVAEAVARGLQWVAARLDAAGSLGRRDPWHLLECVGPMRHPAARTVIERMVPFVLRSQKPDGGWHDSHGERSFVVLRALKAQGIFDDLVGLPPPPPDWRVLRVLDAPAAQPSQLVFDGEYLWTKDGCCLQPQHEAAWVAVAIDPVDGSVARRVPLPRRPGMRSLSLWDGHLAIVGGWEGPRRIYQIDSTTGLVRGELPLDFAGPQVHSMVQVGRELVLAEGDQAKLWAVDPRRPGLRRSISLPGCGPLPMAYDGDAIWGLDAHTDTICRGRLDGTLLDWAAAPVVAQPHRAGIAWDGRHLWVLDPEGRRILQVERTAT